MYIFKRPGSKFFWYSFNYKASRYKGSTKKTNKQDAREWASQLRRQIINETVGIFVQKAPPTFRDFAKEFLETAEVRYQDRQPTLKFYKSKLNNLLAFPVLCNARLDHIDEAMVDRYKLRRKDVVSVSSCHLELATLSVILRLAHERKLINRIPKLSKPATGRGRTFTLSPKDEEILLSACSGALSDLIALLLDTGLRVGEALALTRGDIQLETGSASKYGYVQVRNGKSKNAKRSIPLTKRSRDILSRLVHSTKSQWLFPGRSASEPLLVTSADHQFRRNCDRILNQDGNPLFPSQFVLHSLRHTCLTRLGAAGVDAFTIMKIAGHSSVTVSQMYVHPTSESMERAIRQMETARLQDKGPSNSQSLPHSLPQIFENAA